MHIIIVARSNIAGCKYYSKGWHKNTYRAVSQTDAERRFKQKPYLSCDLRFSTRIIIGEYINSIADDSVFFPLRWVRRRPFLPLSRFVMRYVCVCQTKFLAHHQTIMTCVFQSFYLSDWQGRCAFGGYVAIIMI